MLRHLPVGGLGSFFGFPKWVVRPTTPRVYDHLEGSEKRARSQRDAYDQRLGITGDAIA